jgi:hypothetical protein
MLSISVSASRPAPWKSMHAASSQRLLKMSPSTPTTMRLGLFVKEREAHDGRGVARGKAALQQVRHLVHLKEPEPIQRSQIAAVKSQKAVVAKACRGVTSTSGEGVSLGKGSRTEPNGEGDQHDAPERAYPAIQQITARMSAPGRAIKKKSDENAHDAVEHKDQLALDRLAQMDRRRDLQKIFPGSDSGHGAVPPIGASRAAMSLAWAAVLATFRSALGHRTRAGSPWLGTRGLSWAN